MESSHLIGLPASSLYITPIRRMLVSAAQSGVSAVLLTAKDGRLVSLHASHLPLVAAVTAVGDVAWIRTDAALVVAWAGILAWGAQMDQDAAAYKGFPACFERVAASRKFPFVGRHVGDITESDIAMAQEYAAATGHTGFEIDVDDATKTVVGAYPVDLSPAVDFTDIESTFSGLTVGVEAFAVDVLGELLNRTLEHALANAASWDDL